MNEIVKGVLAMVCTMLSFLFGSRDGIMIALVALIVLDYISGVAASVAEKKVSSEIGAKGIAKKVFMLFIVAVANIVDRDVIMQGNVLRSVVVTFYIANECISLIENAGRLGVPVPKKILEVLEQLKSD